VDVRENEANDYVQTRRQDAKKNGNCDKIVIKSYENVRS
jgi:hypothetical protein